MRRVSATVAAAGGLALAGAAAVVIGQRKGAVGRTSAFGSLRSEPQTLNAADGVQLYVEVDPGPGDLTLVFAHGWMCDLDTWHFQRAALRGAVSMVFYDQRGHGRSGRTGHDNSSVADLADDLVRVVETFAPTRRVVLVGHSMGAMTIQHLAASRPDFIAERVAGVALLSTLSVPLRRANALLSRFGPYIRAMAPLIDRGRAIDTTAIMRRWAVGQGAPRDRVLMIDQMISRSPSRALVDFYPIFLTLDVAAASTALAKVDTVLACGSADLITPLRHARQLAAAIDGSRLRIVPDAGHMLMIERDGAVTDLLRDQLERLQ